MPGNSFSDVRIADLLEVARAEQLKRQLGAEMISDEILRSPAWDMLLDLYIADSAGRGTQTIYLIDAARTSRATGLRWLTFLIDTGWIERCRIQDDKRSRFIFLTKNGRELLERYFTHLR